MYVEWFVGVFNFDYFGFIMALVNGNCIGLFFVCFGIDGILNIFFLYNSDGIINFDNVMEFFVVDYVFILSYVKFFKVKKG